MIHLFIKGNEFQQKYDDNVWQTKEKVQENNNKNKRKKFLFLLKSFAITIVIIFPLLYTLFSLSLSLSLFSTVGVEVVLLVLPHVWALRCSCWSTRQIAVTHATVVRLLLLLLSQSWSSIDF